MGLKIVKVGDLRGKPDQMGDRIYSVKGISPTLAAQRGNNSKGSILVSTQTSSTSTPPKFTKNTMEKSTQETLELSMLKKSQTTIYSVLDSLVRALVSLEKGKDLRTPEGLCFLKSLGLRSIKDPDIYSLKTSRVCLVTTKEKLSRQSLGFSPTWGIELNGRYLIASTLEFPKTGKECSLSDILEEKVDQKYFLSEKAVATLFREVKKGRNGLPIQSQVDTPVEMQEGRTFGQTSRIHSKKGISPTVPTASGGHHIPMVQESDD